ncbi:MAG: DUF2190 family protein [Clostridiales bacterium]|jgi:predicted RecA/RadA family phage recombinase|nr:DUF2190 family protein [Clostridiales bacterium]
MKANYVQRGEAIDYINTGSDTIYAGDIVQIGENRVGVAGCDIRSAVQTGAPSIGGRKGVGSLHIAGVFQVAKADASEEIALGSDVYVTDGGASSDGDVRMGWAIEESPAGALTVNVRLGA